MKNTQLQHLAIAVMGKDDPRALNEITKLAAQNSCNIKESRMTRLGSEFGLIMLLAGSWDAIAKFENTLPALGKRYEWQIQLRRAAAPEYHVQMLPYSVQVIALDNVGLIEQISGFFSAQDINVRELFASTYSASHTGTLMFSLTMAINVPADIQIADLRERFILFCDNLNLDAMIEPDKG